MMYSAMGGVPHAGPWQYSMSLFIFTTALTLCLEFSRQEYWSGLLFPSPRDLPDPGIEPGSPALQADSLPSEPSGKPPYIVLYV